jgi:hypothetical protein
MRQILTVEALGQEELGVGVSQLEVALYPDSLHPGLQRVQCHEERYATTPLRPAYASLVPLHVLPLHIFLPVKFPMLTHSSISTAQNYSTTAP